MDLKGAPLVMTATRSKARSDRTSEHDDDSCYRPELGYGDLRQHAEMPAPSILARVEVSLGRRRAREIKDHRHSGEGPAGDDGQRIKSDAIIAEPFHDEQSRGRSIADAVERAEQRIEDQEEHQSDRDQRHGDRKKITVRISAGAGMIRLRGHRR